MYILNFLLKTIPYLDYQRKSATLGHYFFIGETVKKNITEAPCGACGLFATTAPRHHYPLLFPHGLNSGSCTQFLLPDVCVESVPCLSDVLAILCLHILVSVRSF